MRHRPLIAAALTALTATVAAAQKSDRFLENCQRQGRNDDARACEIRNFTLPALKGLVVDGRENGGVTVHGWDKAQIQIVAMIQAQARSEAEAEAIAKQISVAANNGGIQAVGPDRNDRHNESWSVNYELWAPRITDLSLTASNGGIAVDGVDSRMELETVNGGLGLVDVGGDIRGRTVNGGVNAELSGDRWNGTGLDVRTSNGGVMLTLPSNYSANLETGTVNGGLNLGIPMTVRGSIGKQFSTQLGAGGATIRATTTNGGVTVRRR